MITVVVVESHHHVLEHIHSVLRRKRLLSSSWSMLHFDSHADLACPGEHIPAICCFQPRKSVRAHARRIANDVEVVEYESDESASDIGSLEDRCLYELLDSTSSGIAEWILPLVLSANLRSVHWIRPTNTIRQIPSGKRVYHVGAWSPHISDIEWHPEKIGSFLDLPLAAAVKVDWGCRYYLEDDSVAPLSELALTQPLSLVVSEPNESSSDALDSDNDEVIVQETAIDVCLDFFVCVNPFLTDIEQKDTALANVMLDIFNQSKFSNEMQENDTTYHTDLSTFRTLWTQVFESCRSNTSIESPSLNSCPKALLPYYNSETHARKLIDMVEALLVRHVEVERVALIDMMLDALPHLSMPHTKRRFLDDEAEVNDAIQSSLLHFRRELSRWKAATMKDPFVITIARSMDDGFTPPQVVDHIQRAVLHEIHNRFCACEVPSYFRQSTAELKSSECRLSMVLDYRYQSQQV